MKVLKLCWRRCSVYLVVLLVDMRALPLELPGRSSPSVASITLRRERKGS
jgi:hypothetical protein